MDKPISVGDLVVVVRPLPCSCPTRRLGMIWHVTKITSMRTHCIGCGAQYPEMKCAANGERYNGELIMWALNRLKRIPPLDELESEKREETINA